MDFYISHLRVEVALEKLDEAYYELVPSPDSNEEHVQNVERAAELIGEAIETIEEFKEELSLPNVLSALRNVLQKQEEVANQLRDMRVVLN